jgi:hypothetical protein
MLTVACGSSVFLFIRVGCQTVGKLAKASHAFWILLLTSSDVPPFPDTVLPKYLNVNASLKFEY